FLALLDDQEALARFVQEGRLLARIRHPNVIRTYEMGELDEHPYMVVEYLPGGTLQDRLASGRRIGLGDAVRVACDCLNGLQACHERGVIHRDLKPANVLFTGDGLAKIADLGVASYYGARDRMTRPGEVLGTPRYMAPEQAAGQPVSVESDLYSLALILYEMVAGRPPFDASTPVEWMTNHLEVPAAPLRAHVHDVPDRLARVVDRALSKRADQRPPTASDFLAELSRCPVPPPAREEPPPPARPAEVESTVRKTAVSMPQVKITPDDRDVGRAYDSATRGAFRRPSPLPPAPTTPDRPAVTTTVELLPDQLRQFEDRAAAGDAQPSVSCTSRARPALPTRPRRPAGIAWPRRRGFRPPR
ncbi:MAG: serine/threonine protein kinase, partial [Candidatus Riflebacteria bacterium]|nr:serine/threonine protein kinase [Candidatus Riflebacteria bacterium]